LGAVRGTFSVTYEAESMLLLTPLGVTSEGAKLLATAPTAKVYSGMLTSPQIAAETMDKLVAEGVIPDDDLPRLVDFIGMLSVEVETVDATTRPVTYSPLIRLRVEAYSHEQAEAIAKAWSEVAIDRVNKMLVLPFIAVSTTLTAQATASEEKLQTIWTELSQEKSQYDLELMRQQANLQLIHLDLLQTELLTTKSALEGLQKSIVSIREVLAAEKPFLELAKAPSDEAFWLTETELGADRAFKELSGKVMVSQEINLAYWNMKEKEGQTASEIAANEGKIASLTALIEQARAENKTLMAALGEHTIKQKELESREAVAKIVYDDIAKASALNAATLGMIHSPDGDGLQPVGLNLLSDKIQSTRVSSLLGGRRAAFTGGILGFLLICSIVVVRDTALPWLRRSVAKHGEIT